MNNRNSDKPDSISKRNIRIPDLLKKSREKQIHLKKNKSKSGSIDIEYGTDSKKCSNNNSYYYGQFEQMKAIIQSCNNCLQKMSQFKTKKPQKKESNLNKQEKGTQTTNKPFLIDLIQERVSEVCRQNRKLTKILINKEEQLSEKQSQLVEIQEKFTNILYTLGQEMAQLKIGRKEAEEMQKNVPTNTETPSYLKALMMDVYP